jgi:hypothetical protein
LESFKNQTSFDITRLLYYIIQKNEKKFKKMEKERSDAMEVAKEDHES